MIKKRSVERNPSALAKIRSYEEKFSIPGFDVPLTNVSLCLQSC